MNRFGTAVALVAIALTLTVGSALANSDSRPFKSSGSGTQVAGGPHGCQFGFVCTVTINGTATSSHLGTGPYMSALTIDYADVTFPSATEYCAPVTGNSTLYAANGDEVFVSTTGQVCASTAAGAVHTLTATYTITGGTGRFEGATGSGTETGTDNGGANSSYTLSGTIGY